MRGCHRQVAVVAVGPAAILGTPIGQDAQQQQAVLFLERQHPVIEQIGRGDGRLGRIQLVEGHLGVGGDEDLLVDPIHTI